MKDVSIKHDQTCGHFGTQILSLHQKDPTFFFVLMRHPIICGRSTVLADGQRWVNRAISISIRGWSWVHKQNLQETEKEACTGYGL